MSSKKRKAQAAPAPMAPIDTEEQSGDLQGLSDVAAADSESVRELEEEGQFFEAGIVAGVENAPPADAGPLRVRRRREDDVPPEYTDQPPDEPKE